MLVDGGAYFGALRAAMLRARHAIRIACWDMHRRTRLVGESGKADDGAPEEFAPFLEWLVRRRPELRISILLWDYSIIYASERDPVPAFVLDWTTPSRITIRLDRSLPTLGSHHQKIVTIDGKLAFSGGIDPTIRRWDTPCHAIDDARRTDPSGEGYRPFHDVQIAVSGKAARALDDLLTQRWLNAGFKDPTVSGAQARQAAESHIDPWPDDLRPDFQNVGAAISRTHGLRAEVDEVREVEQLYVRMIECAEREIYLENQFFTSHSVADALCAALKRRPALEAVLIGPNVHHTWLEEHAMDSGRRRFMERLKKAGVTDRVRLLYPAIPDDSTDQGVMVHSKVAIVDDALLRVGSANLNNRSMGLDTECDITLEARSDDHRASVLAVRNRLLAEHLGCEADGVARAVQKEGSLIAAIERLSQGNRCLRAIETGAAPADFLATAVSAAADPDGAIEPVDVLNGMWRERDDR